MKLNTLTKLMKWFSAISLACAATSLVGVPVDIDYNGSLADDSGSLLDGDYFFKFAIAPEAPADATEIYWSNAPWDAGASMPDAALTVAVSAGTFSVLLEDVDSAVLGNPDLTLHVWISDAADGTFEYLGANPINSVPYAVVAGYAEAVSAENVSGQISMEQIADGSINADKLGTILIDVPFIDADGDGQPDAAGEQNVSMKTIIESISKNSKLGFNDVNPNRDNFEVFLELGQPVGSIEGYLNGGLSSATPGIFVDPFPISQVYEYNGGLMPIISIIDENGNDITGTAGSPIPGLTFSFVQQDVESTSAGTVSNDGLTEPRLIVQGTPNTLGDYTVRVKATNRWGMDFVQEYIVRVRDVDIDTTVFNERQSLGSSTWTQSGANTPFGGDPVRFRFIVEDENNVVIPLADDVLVRWTYPNPNGFGTLTSDILGPTGQTFYVNSGTTPEGLGPSMGVIELDENPFNPDISHEGTYSAQILFDWGQGVNVGSDVITDIQEGYTYSDFTSIRYHAPDGLGFSDLFDQFEDAGSYTAGDESIAGQFFGATPAGDEPLWNLVSTIEAGETLKNLVGENPFNVINPGGYIRGTVSNIWVQQKYAWVWNGSTWVKREVSLKDLNRTTLTDGVSDPTINLDLDGFGPIDPTGWPLPTTGGAGVVADRETSKRAPFDYPQDGGDFTFHAGPGVLRPGGAFGGVATGRSPIEALNYLQFPGSDEVFVTYWLYSTNGYIDSLAPIAAIVEVGNNINVVNDLLPATQVAGYPTQVGGDFGTTNDKDTDVLKPDPVTSPTQIIAWGINDLAYIWNAQGNNNGFSLVNPANANSILIPGTSMVNTVTPNDSSVDFSYQLGLDSGYSHETTSANVSVVSDVVIWDFFVQEIDLNFNKSDPLNYYPQTGAESTIGESITIDQGDDLLLTVQAYVRPSLLTGLDDGGLTAGLLRTLNSRFFLVPTITNVAVEITNNISMTVDDVVGVDVDLDDNHVQGPVENRVLVTWEVILENPLQALAQTNVATGYLYAVISSSLNGQVINTVSTLAGHSNQIAPNSLAIGDDTENSAPQSVAEENVISPSPSSLDARVKMPLTTSEAAIVVNPAP